GGRACVNPARPLLKLERLRPPGVPLLRPAASRHERSCPVSDDGVLIGVSDHPQILRFDRANRHGLVAGATGTGKTVTLQVLAQGLSDAGVPVFAADVKGDLSG